MGLAPAVYRDRESILSRAEPTLPPFRRINLGVRLDKGGMFVT